MSETKFELPSLPDPASDPCAFNEALRGHMRKMVEDQAKLIEERYGYSRETTADTILRRPPNMRVVAQAVRELEEFREMTARAFARYMVPEPIFFSAERLEATPTPPQDDKG